MKDGTVSAAEISDANKAVEIAQVDIKDGVSKIINRKFDALAENTNAVVEVIGENKGIKHVFEITSDAARGNSGIKE